MAKLPINARKRLGFFQSKSGCRVSASTVASARVGRGQRRLDREPLVDHQPVVAPGGVEVGERRLGLAVGDEEAERGHPLGHVVGGGELRAAPRAASGSSAVR